MKSTQEKAIEFIAYRKEQANKENSSIRQEKLDQYVDKSYGASLYCDDLQLISTLNITADILF